MATRKKTATSKPALRAKPSSATRRTGRDASTQSGDSRSFLSSYSSAARTDLMLPTPRDFRKDLTSGNRLEMLARMRYGERNFGLTRQIYQDNVTYTVGSGLFPTSHASDADIAREHVEFFMQWARICDVTRRFSYWDIQRIVQRRKWADGDMFVAIVLTDDLVGPQLQLIEAHRVATPYTFGQPRKAMSDDGVNYDEAGKVVSYTIVLDNGKSQDIDAANIIHVFSPEWASGSRGLPRLQHSWSDIQDYMELVSLEKQASKLHSEYAVVFNTDNGALPGPDSNELTNADTDPISYVTGGKIISAPKGQTVDLKSSQRPNANFVAYLEAMQRDIAMAGIPYEFVADSSKLGSVGIRLIGSKAARIFEAEQNEMNVRLNDKVWAVVIGWGIRMGLIRPDDKFMAVSWTGPKDVTVDAGRDAKNDRDNIASGLTSFTEVYRVNGSDFSKEALQLARDYRHLYDLEKEHGLPEGVLTQGLRKGLTLLPEPANVTNTDPTANA